MVRLDYLLKSALIFFRKKYAAKYYLFAVMSSVAAGPCYETVPSTPEVKTTSHQKTTTTLAAMGDLSA